VQSRQFEDLAADHAQDGRDVHVADLAFRACRREAAAEAVVSQAFLPVALEDLAEYEEALLASAVGDEAVADPHGRLPRLHPRVGCLHRFAEADLGRFERIKGLNLHGYHLLLL